MAPEAFLRNRKRDDVLVVAHVKLSKLEGEFW